MFCKFSRTNAVIWLGLGVLAGLLAAGFWPSVPLHAVATDKVETFSMATGEVEPGVEAVYFLDHLTGELHAYVLGPTRQGYGLLCHYYRAVADDFKASEKAKYLLATGLVDLLRGGRGSPVQPSHAVVYVAEVSSGYAIAYYVPYNVNAHRAGTFLEGTLLPVCAAFPIRKPIGEGAKPTRRSKPVKEE